MTEAFLSDPGYASLVTPIFPYACESWTLTTELQRRIWAMEMKCFSKIKKRPCYQRGNLWQDLVAIQTTQRPPDHCKETQTEVVWIRLLFIRSGQNHLVRHKGERRRGRQEKRWEDNLGKGPAWSLPSPRGQWRTQKSGGNWLWSHLWCPKDPSS